MKDLQNNWGGSTFEELQESLDFSWETIWARILEDLQSIWKIDDSKLKKFNAIKAEKWNDYAMEYMRKVFKEVKVWLNNHEFSHQKRQDIVKSMKEWIELSGLLWVKIYQELKDYVFDLFEKLINQPDANTSSTEQGDFVKRHNEQYTKQEKMRNFITTHMSTFEKLWNMAFTSVVILTTHDVMSKTELLDSILEGNTSEKKRIDTEKIISKMIEKWIIKETWENLSLNYEWEENVLPTEEKGISSASLETNEKQPNSKKNMNPKETSVEMTLQERESDITKKITGMKIKELNSQLDDKEKVPENSVSFRTMVWFDKFKEIQVSKDHPLMPILQYANVLLQKHNNNHQGGVNLWSIEIVGGKKLELPVEFALAKMFYPIYWWNGKIAKSFPHEVRELMICLDEAAKRYDMNRKNNDKFSVAAFHLICGFWDNHSFNREENNLAKVLETFTRDLT